MHSTHHKAIPLHIPRRGAALGNNRLALTGYQYDGSGNLTNDGTHTYQYDAEGQMANVDSGGSNYHSYMGGPDGQRVRKAGADGTATEYIRFNGETLSDWNTFSDWSDYIYAVGKRIARADNYEDELLTQGTSCSSCATYFRLRNGTGYLLSGYVIQTGDKLMVRQWQSSGVHGGVGLDFASGNTLTLGNMASDPNNNQWDYRSFDLSTVAGNTVTSAWVTTQSTPASGGWNINYQDFVLLGFDGTVHKLYSHDKSANLEISGTTGPTYSVTHVPNLGNVSDQTTTFYHGDHLGSSRLLSNANGYPTWQGTYYPYGMEYTPPTSTDNTATVNNFKFTGKERDAESGLDYFGARYYANTMGRFMSIDPAPITARVLLLPQRFNRYSYVIGNPLSRIDVDGLSDVFMYIFRQIETTRSTTGSFRLLTPDSTVEGFTLEPPDKGNQQKISRIPQGIYDATSVATANTNVNAILEVSNVPGRTRIRVHPVITQRIL